MTPRPIRTAEAALADIDAILARAIISPRPTLWQRLYQWITK